LANSAGAAGEARERLKFVRPSTAAADVFRIIGVSAFVTPVTYGSSAIATRIPVLTGDVIGLGVAPPSAALGEHTPKCTWFSGQLVLGDRFRQRTPTDEDPDPATDLLWNAGSTSARLSVSATLEPDADGDGFGDETQDRCSPIPRRTVPARPPP
jgi:hypothetical protein